MIPLPTSVRWPPDPAPAGRYVSLIIRGWLGAAGVDAEQPAAAELEQRGLVEHLDLEPACGDRVPTATSARTGRVEVAVRGVGEVARQLRDGGERRRRVGALSVPLGAVPRRRSG